MKKNKRRGREKKEIVEILCCTFVFFRKLLLYRNFSCSFISLNFFDKIKLKIFRTIPRTFHHCKKSLTGNIKIITKSWKKLLKAMKRSERISKSALVIDFLLLCVLLSLPHFSIALFAVLFLSCQHIKISSISKRCLRHPICTKSK